MMLVWLKHVANGLDKSWLKQTRAQKNVDKTGLALWVTTPPMTPADKEFLWKLHRLIHQCSSSPKAPKAMVCTLVEQKRKPSRQ